MYQLDFKRHRWALLFCALSSIGALCYGYDNTYFTGVMGMRPFINDYGHLSDEGKRTLGVTFTSLSASSIYIGDTLGALMCAPINDFFGRVIVLGRILIGLGVGQFTVTSLLYIGEVAPLQIRGPALMMFQFLQSCSQLVASGISQGTESISNAAAYRIPMGGLVVLPLMMFIALPFMPESPTWLVYKGLKEQATRSLRTIHRSILNYDPTDDLAKLEVQKAAVQHNMEGSSWLSLLTDRVERRKTIFSCGAMFAQQINGILFFYVYGVIFAQAIGIKQPFTISLITNILQIFAVGAAVLLGNQVRRRVNLLVTMGMMFFAFIVIGGIGTMENLTTASQYIIVIFSYVIICAFNFVLGPLAYTVAREMAVGRNENKIMSASIVTFFVTTRAVSFTAPYMYYTANLGPMLGFVYAGTTLISLTYIWFCVGETTGKPNLEISALFAQDVPVRKWRTTQLPDSRETAGEKNSEESTEVEEIEKQISEHHETVEVGAC